MKSLRDELKQRTVGQIGQLRLLGRLGRRLADKLKIIELDRVVRISLRHLIEEPGIDRACFGKAVGMLVMQEGFAEKLTHLSIDLARSKIIVIEKNLKPRARLFVVVRQRHGNLWHRRRG